MKTLNIYKLSQIQNTVYDTYDSCVVIAENEENAKNITPSGYKFSDSIYGDWCSSPDHVTAELIGEAVRGSTVGVVLASYNAG
jgi:hypothetical protein